MGTLGLVKNKLIGTLGNHIYICNFQRVKKMRVIQKGTQKEDRYYLKNQSGYHHSTNIAVDVHFMTPDLLKQLLNAVTGMKNITFRGVPGTKRFVHFLLNQLNCLKF
jgi:hypothetical protein